MDLPNTRLRRDDPRPMASSPLIVVPIASAVVLGAVKPWPGQGGACGKVGATANPSKGPSVRRIGCNKQTNEGEENALLRWRNPLTRKAPYKACSAFTRVAACTLARSPYIVTRYPKASAISLPP